MDLVIGIIFCANIYTFHCHRGIAVTYGDGIFTGYCIHAKSI